MLDVQVYSNTFIKLGNDNGAFITQKKLQALLYLANQFSLKEKGKPLFAEAFEKKESGAMLNSIYTHYSSFGEKPITRLIKIAYDGSAIILNGEFTYEAKIITHIWRVFGKYPADILFKAVNGRHSAWDKTLHVGDLISNEDITRTSIISVRDIAAVIEESLRNT